MKFYIFLRLSFPIIYTVSIHTFTPNGYCNKPIADLVVAPIKNLYANKNNKTQNLYAQLPLDDTNNGKDCRRIGQLLLHDPVEIIESKDNEICITTPQWQYQPNNKQGIKYWTLKDNISLYNKKNENLLPNNIPFQTKNQIIVTLKKPWKDHKSNKTYSVGTRFVVKSKGKNKYCVWCSTSHCIKAIYIPSSYLITEEKNQNDQARKIFIELIKSWSINFSTENNPKKSIPYVLGGSSYIYKNNTLSLFRKNQFAAGFDCSHLITRSAQIAGIPLYAANSTMLLKNLKPLKKNETLQEGDIIYFSGHVAVISDIQNNLITEARSSTTNDYYGLIQTIPLYEQFKGINTISDLTNAYFNNTKIQRTDKNGNFLQNIKIKILKIC